MARIVGVTFETTADPKDGSVAVPEDVARLLHLGPDEPTDVRILWEGHGVELATPLQADLRLFRRQQDPTTVELSGIPRGTQLLVTVWRASSDFASNPTAGYHWGDWDEPSFFKRLGEVGTEEEVSAAKGLLDWAVERGLRLWFGQGHISGSMYFIHRTPDAKEHETFSIWTTGSVGLPLQYLARSPAFASEEARLALIEELNSALGVAIDRRRVSKFPSIRLSVLADEQARARFIKIYDRVLERQKEP